MKILQHTALQPGFSLQPGLIDPVNYADDPEIVERVKKLFAKKDQIETQRQPLERDWIEYHKIWAQENDGAPGYQGMHSVFLPDTYILTETEVDHLKSEIFPFNNNIAVRPWWSNPVAPMMVFPVLELLQYDINQAEVRSNIDVVLRDSIKYGWKGVKVAWEVRTITDYARAYVQDPFSGANVASSGFTPREVVQFEGPTFHPVSCFSLYVHPFNESSPSKLQWIHENMNVGWDFLLSMQSEGIYHGVERLLSTDGKAVKHDNTLNSDQNNEELNSRLGITEDQIGDENDTFKLTEIWTKFDLYGQGQLVPCKITYSGPHVLEVRQNPYNDQEPPYVFHRDGKVTESFYGRSRIKSVKALQYTTNAVWNQGLDSNAFASNNMVVIDVSRLRGRVEDLEIAPLTVFQMNGDASDKAVRFVAPPNTIQQNVVLGQTLSQQMRDAFRIPTAMQGKTAEDATATEIATTTQAGMVGIGGVANNFENDLMSKWLTKAYRREQQFRGIDSEMRAGLPQVPAEALVPDYQLQFLAGDAAAQYQQQVAAVMQQAQGGMEGAPHGGDHPNGQKKPVEGTNTPENGGAQ